MLNYSFLQWPCNNKEPMCIVWIDEHLHFIFLNNHLDYLTEYFTYAEQIVSRS